MHFIECSHFWLDDSSNFFASREGKKIFQKNEIFFEKGVDKPILMC